MMRPRVRFGFLLVLFLSIFSLGACLFPASAEEQQPKARQLKELEVVASPIIEGNQLDRYASEKTVVSEEQIRDLNAQDLPSALRMTPGVNISRYNPIGSFGGAEGGAVFIRGQGSSRPGAEIKTLVDGVPMYMSVWNHPLLDLMSIDPAHTIEVYKSPQPQYFGNAFAVVNIVPKRVETEGFVTRAQGAGGSYDTFVATADHGGKKGRLDYFVGGGYRTSSGYRDHSDGKLRDAFGRVGYKVTDNWDVSLFSLWSDNYALDPGAEGADPSLRQGKFETRSLMGVGTVGNHYDKAEGYIKLYCNNGEGDWLDQPTDTELREDLYNDFLFYGIKAREVFHFWKGGEIISGLDWDYTEGKYKLKYSDGSKNDWDGSDFSIVSPYVAVSQLIGEKKGFYAIPSAGVRYYANTDFDSEWAPYAGIILGYKETEFHAGYSRGVIYPGLDVFVFSEEIIPALGDSWKNLKAERVDHYEVGIRHRFGSLAVADLTFFYDDGKDRYVIVPPPPPPPLYENLESYQIRGLETTLTMYPFQDMAMFAGLTYLNTEPSNLPYTPEFTASAGVNWRFFEHFKISIDSQYVSNFYALSWARRKGAENTEKVDSYILVNAKLGYLFDVPSWGMGCEVFVAGENLTDADYEYRPGYPMPGINGMAGVQLSF
jgi:outer membrane receptor protein involved in Fe transport